MSTCGNDKIRVRFTELRRLYGSKKFQEPLNDEFFKTRTALAYHQSRSSEIQCHRSESDLFHRTGKSRRCRHIHSVVEPLDRRSLWATGPGRPHDPVDEKTWCAARTVGIMVTDGGAPGFCSAVHGRSVHKPVAVPEEERIL